MKAAARGDVLKALSNGSGITVAIRLGFSGLVDSGNELPGTLTLIQQQATPNSRSFGFARTVMRSRSFFFCDPNEFIRVTTHNAAWAATGAIHS